MGTLFLGVLGEKLGKALHNCFPNATISLLPLFSGNANCFEEAPSQLAAIFRSLMDPVSSTTENEKPPVFSASVPILNDTREEGRGRQKVTGACRRLN